MTEYVKRLLSYVSRYFYAMRIAGQNRDIYKILYEPHDGVHHSTEVTLYANPEFEDVIEESDISNAEEGMEEMDNSGASEDHSEQET